MKSRVYISLLNWNSEKDCIRCVQSLKELKIEGADVHIGIVDNQSSQTSFNALKEALPNENIYREESNYGYAAGHAVNLIKAKEWNADYFWVLNVDTTIHPNALNAFMQAVEENGNHIFGSISLLDEKHIDFGGAVNDKTKINYNDWQGKTLNEYLVKFPKYQEVQSVEGSSMFIPLRVIHTHGFLKTDFFMYGEETEYCLRLKDAGVKSILVSSSRIHHANEGSFVQNEQLKLVPKYYRRRNALRVSREFFKMSGKEALSYKSTTLNTIKGVVKGWLYKKDEAYYLSLANLHAYLGIKGKRIKPEKFRD